MNYKEKEERVQLHGVRYELQGGGGGGEGSAPRSEI